MPTPRYTLDNPTLCDDPAMLESLKRCGVTLSRAIALAGKHASEGATPIELAATVEQELVKLGATPILKGLSIEGTPVFPAAAAICVNEIAVNGVPSDTPLVRGDVVTIDSACELNGTVCDAAVSIVVGGGGSELVSAARAVLTAALDAIRPGEPIGVIVEAAKSEAHRRGFGLADECVAHGTGLALHQPPAVFAGSVEPADGVIERGQILAVEPVVVERRGERLRTLADGWSRAGSGRSAFEERTIVVDEKGPIELTPLAFGGW